MGSAATHRPVTDHCMSVYGIAKSRTIRITDEPVAWSWRFFNAHATLRLGNFIRLILQYLGCIPSDSELPTPFCIT